MTKSENLRAVIAALAVDGFEPTLTSRVAVFRGERRIAAVTVKLRVEFRDLEFFEPPYVFIENPEELGRPVLPHLDEHGELCVIDRRSYVSDMYNAAGQARGIIVKAGEVIERGLTRHATEEIAGEFPQHWGGLSLQVAFGSYQGFTLFDRSKPIPVLLKHKGPSGATGYAVATAARLSFDRGQARPATLQEFMDWAARWDQNLPTRVGAALARLSPADPHCLIVAPNGMVGFQLMVSERGRAQMIALARPDGWRRAVRSSFAAGLSIRRDYGHRADLAYALGRNGGGVAPLSGKQIVLVGCGSIGGLLARSLAQFGAGQDGGKLTLIDDDHLAVANLGRHSLGAADVGRLKVEACRDLIQRDLPGAQILARAHRVQSQQALVMRADLVVDATGEQGISEMLNAWMIEGTTSVRTVPDLLHVWIEGSGAAVQTFFASDPAYACFRCLRPNHEQPARFKALKDGVVPAVAGGCGETPFTPYGPSAPMMAAALAAQHAADWAKGRPRPLLRSGRLDWESTKDVKPANPSASRHCPACKRSPH